MRTLFRNGTRIVNFSYYISYMSLHIDRVVVNNTDRGLLVLGCLPCITDVAVRREGQLVLLLHDPSDQIEESVDLILAQTRPQRELRKLEISARLEWLPRLAEIHGSVVRLPELVLSVNWAKARWSLRVRMVHDPDIRLLGDVRRGAGWGLGK